MAIERNTSIPRCARRLGRVVAIVALLAGFHLSGLRAGASEPKPLQPFYNQFSSEDEVRLGAALAAEIERDGIPFAGRHGERLTVRIKRDDVVEHYLESIASKLGQCSQRPEVQYSVRVLDAPEVINAISIPGGHIYVTSGLLDFVQTEAELAAVLGHEIGHIVGRHSINRIARVNLFTILVGQARESGLIPDDATAQKLADTAMPLLFAVDARTFYSRDDEIEADLLGFYELGRAGWDPEGEISLLSRLAKASPEQSPLAALIATHPNSSDRLLIVKDEYKTARFPIGLKRDSLEFEAMKHPLDKTPDKRPSPQPIVLALAALGVCAALLLTRALWSRKERLA
jgi:predicted Zn-dependent protease